MPDPTSQPSEEEIRDFLDRLDVFHDSLPASEKSILEQLTHVALSRADAEVQGFQTMTEYPILQAFALLITTAIPAHPQQQDWMTPGMNPPGSRPLGGP